MFAYFEKFQGAATQTRTLPSSRPLTKAELEVLASLLLGQTAKVIARGRGASVNTVRSQITSILGKTGHHTQKELIASFSASAFDASGQDDGELLRSN
jgi:DNA-binding CsgD family transcriptional regulator